MYQYLLQEKRLFIILLLWTAIGAISSMAALVLIPLHLLSLRGKGEYLLMLIGLWFIFTLSDSRQGLFRFAQTVKPFAMLIISYMVWEERHRWPATHFFKAFVPFFAIAIVGWMSSPYQFTSAQKMLSYFLLLFTVPQLVQRLLLVEKERFLKLFIGLGSIILGLGLVLKYTLPGFVLFVESGRYSGLLGNPNGLGIYAFCFLMLYTLIRHFHPYLVTKQEHWIIYGVIALSLIFSGSRGGIFSSLMFLAAYYLFQQSTLMGMIVMIATFASYQLVMANLETIIVSLNLQDYFRLDTLEKGSGRVMAHAFARKHIEYNYWWGRGFGYAEYLMLEWKDYFLSKGHQGNVHNSYLTIWLDTGLVGLLAVCWGWLKNIYDASKFSPLAWAILFGALLTTSVESWLAASMNPFTIQLVIIISMLGMEEFYVS